MNSTTDASYTTTAKIFHWLIALAVIFMLALGWCMDFVPRGEPRFFAIQLHKSIGITILLLSVARLGWRLMHKSPPWPYHMKNWEKLLASNVHWFLYVLMIGMPLTGWAMVSASPRNIPTVLYGIFPWPNLPILSVIENKKEVSDFFAVAHSLVAYIFAALVAGHAVAALKHHFFSQDDILLRMMPRYSSGFLNRLRGLK